MKVVFVFFIGFLTLGLAQKDTILFASVSIRHGARNLIHERFKNITSEEYQKDFGRLTNIGKHQLYLLGKQLSFIYIQKHNLLKTEYDPFQVVVRSSGLNRTVESGEAFLSGLYSPGTGKSLSAEQIAKTHPPISVKNIESIKEELRDAALPSYMSPIPIHTTTGNGDHLFSPHTECTYMLKREKETKILQHSYQLLSEEYKDFYPILEKELHNLNIFVDHWNIDRLYQLADTIASVKGNNYPLKLSYDKQILSNLTKASLKDSLKKFLGYDLKVKMLCHPILFDTYHHFRNTLNSKILKKPKMSIFMISDAHIMAFFRLFKWKLDVAVPYTSSLIFELHQIVDPSNAVSYNVQILYNGEQIDSLSWDKFEAFAVEHTYPSEKEFMQDCYKSHGEGFDRETYFALAIVLFICFLTLWGSNWFILVKKQREMKESLTTIEYA